MWPLFHGPVILPYILKIVSCINIIRWDYESVNGTTFNLKIKVGHCDLYFIVQWFCLISWRLFDIWTPYFGIMSHYDPVFDLRINVGHCDLFFSWSSDFALYLENYSVAEHHTLGLRVSMTWCLTSKYLWVTVTYISWSTEFALHLKTVWCITFW